VKRRLHKTVQAKHVIKIAALILCIKASNHFA